MRVAQNYCVEVLANEFLVNDAPDGHLLTEWQELWNISPAALTFQRPEWVLAWIRNFQPREPLLLTVRFKGKLVGIAPCLFYERSVYEDGAQETSAERVLGLMGGGVSDYLDILLDPKHDKNVILHLWQWLREQNNRCDLIEFTDLPATSSLLRNVSLLSEKQSHDRCSVLPIPEDARDLKQIIPPHKWENIRNGRNRLQRAGGGRIEIADEFTLEAALEELFRLHRARWAQESLPGVLNHPSIREFHRSVAPALLTKNVLRLYSLRVKGICIASAYTFFEREQALCYLHGYDPQYAQLSPGTLVLAAAMEDAIRLGKKTINFLRGEEDFKKTWGVLEEETFCLRMKISNCLPANTRAA